MGSAASKSCLVLSREWGNGSHSSPYTIPNNSRHNPCPHSLLRTRQKGCRGSETAESGANVPLFKVPYMNPTILGL